MGRSTDESHPVDVTPARRGTIARARSSNSGRMSFGIYIVGYLILITGLGIGANLLHVPKEWIGVGVLCLVGLAILHGVKVTRHKDPT